MQMHSPVANAGTAWALYDAEEATLWAAYAEDPGYLAGRRYIGAEHEIRARMERAVQSVRYRQPHSEPLELGA